VNHDRDRAPSDLTRRNPFWACLLVFGLLAVDTGFRFARSVRERKQLDNAQMVQAQNVGRMTETLRQLPQIEARLQALSLDLFQVAKTNSVANRIVREFNIQWTPGPETFLPPPAPPPAISASETPATAVPPSTTAAPMSNAPAAQ